MTCLLCGAGAGAAAADPGAGGGGVEPVRGAGPPLRGQHGGQQPPPHPT